jgi:hypothetical protein
MDNLNDLKAIWLTANTDSLPASGEMLRMAKKFRNGKIRHKLIMIFIAILLAAIMVFGAINNGLTMLSTWIGEACLIVTCMLLAFTNIRSIRRFIDFKDSTNKEFIEFMEQTRRNQLYYYQKTQVAGMGISSIGLLLYFYEIVYRDTVLFIITYSAAIIYLAVMWFVVRPRNFKRQNLKMDETMRKLHNISNQIKND